MVARLPDFVLAEISALEITMAFVYQVSFNIQPDQMEDLAIGSALERALAALRALLPDQAGYVSSRGMHSLDRDNTTRIVFESVWDDWDDFQTHIKSSIAEDRVIQEFHPHLSIDNLTTHTFEEVD
jgi:heme-degrading monooxygenase HmoA